MLFRTCFDFKTGAPVPLQRTDQFQVVDTRIPWIEDDAIWLKLSFISYLEHIPERVIFILPVLVGMIDPEIYENYRRTFGPDGRYQIDPLNNPRVFPTPVSGDQFDLIWIGLVKVLSSITSTPSSGRINRFASLYNASVWWGCFSNNRLTESWAIDSGSPGKHRDASEHEHAWYVDMRKLTKLLLVHFGGFTLIRSPFRVCPALNGFS